MRADHVLTGAETALRGRMKEYGSPDASLGNIAALWSVILQTEVTPSEVALCMSALKIARLINTPQHFDSWCDLAGYAAMGGEVATCGDEEDS